MINTLKERLAKFILFMTEMHNWRSVIILFAILYIVIDYFQIHLIDRSDVIFIIILCYISLCEFITYTSNKLSDDIKIIKEKLKIADSDNASDN